jgi:peptide/nickel transport system permease protein
MTRITTRDVGIALLAVAALAGVLAPWLGPHRIDQTFTGLLNAPPTRIHIVDETGRWRAPFIYPWTRVSQLEQRYEADRSTPVPLVWFSGRFLESGDDARAPLLLLGADSYGRDVFARLLSGARVSLALSLLAALGATIIGGLIGAVAGYVGGAVDEGLMRGSEFVLVLPAMYVALALRSVMPLVLASSTVFLLLAAIFAFVGAPFIARGVRGIVRSERRLDYSAAVTALGAGHLRLITRHLLPAARGFVLVQLTMLVPAFIVAEATLSYVGLGFPDTVPSWGTMLHDASNVRAIADFPWLLSPAAAIFLVVLGLNLTLQGRSEGVHFERPM